MYVDIYKTDTKFNIIYADPPWQYKVWNKKNKFKRSAESYYNTMSKSEIQRLPVKNIAEKDSVLFLWVTIPCLPEGLELLQKWGFQYKTVAFVWVKKNKNTDSFFWGLGHYTRSNIELCLLATRGKGLPRVNRNIHQIIYSPIREHSRKPDETREKIIHLFGNKSKIELFAREQFDNWYCWGNQVNLFNEKQG